MIAFRPLSIALGLVLATALPAAAQQSAAPPATVAADVAAQEQAEALMQAQLAAQAQAEAAAQAQVAAVAQDMAQTPPPGVYATQAASLSPPPQATPNPALTPVATPATPPASLPPLPGSNAAEVAHAQDALLGLSPDQIRVLREMVDARVRASTEMPNPPESVTGSVSVSLSPGATPPILRPFIGRTSSFVVLDSTGAPWPVENFRIANPELFPVNRLDGPQGSAFTVDTNMPYGQSNLVLKLVGVPAPVVLTLIAGQREFDARVEVRVQGRGPNSTVSSGTLMAGTDSRLLPVLDGIAPPGGKPLRVGGLDGVRAWMLPTGRMMVRSPSKIVSPASTTFVTSADGTHVYEFSPTTQLLALVDGRFVQMTVAGW